MVTLLHTRLYDLHLRALSHRPLARGGMREADVAFVINFGLWEIVRFVYQQIRLIQTIVELRITLNNLNSSTILIDY